MQKKLSSLITVVLFLIMLTAPTLLYFTIGENTENALDEKRALAGMPECFHNAYLQDIEKWYNDHAPYRISLITFLLEQTQKYSAAYRSKIRPALSALMTPSWYNEEYKQWAGIKEPYLAPMEDYLVNYGREDWLYYTGDNSIGFFTGSNLLDPEEMVKWGEAFQELQKCCEAKGIRLVYFVPPNKEQVYPEYMASYRIENLPKREEIINEYMQQKGLPFTYGLEVLKSHKTDRTIYYKQDSHWNEIGAFAATMKIYEMLGMPVTALEDIEVRNTEKTGGDLSNFCGYATTYPDYDVIYKPEVSYTFESYRDGYIEIFHSDSENEHNLVLIGDSMRNGNKDYLARDFRQSTILFRNYIEEPEVTEALLALKEGDVLLLQIGERHDQAIYDVTQYLLGLLQEQNGNK